MSTKLTTYMIFLTASSLVACATTPAMNRRVIDQSPGITGTPSWVTGSNKFKAEEGRVGFKGTLSMEHDARGEACTQAAANDAKGKIAQMISSSVIDESGFSGDQKSVVAQRLVASLSKQKFVGVETTDEFWQIVEISGSEDGKPTRRMDCWARITIPQDLLDSALKRALADLNGTGEERAKIEAAIAEMKK